MACTASLSIKLSTTYFFCLDPNGCTLSEAPKCTLRYVPQYKNRYYFINDCQRVRMMHILCVIGCLCTLKLPSPGSSLSLRELLPRSFRPALFHSPSSLLRYTVPYSANFFGVAALRTLTDAHAHTRAHRRRHICALPGGYAQDCCTARCCLCAGNARGCART